MEINKLNNIILNALEQYGTHYNEERAVPSIVDGLKPVQRKLLYACKLLGLKSGSKKAKAIAVNGKAMAFYTHGDSSLSGALVRMQQEFKIGNSLIEPQGAWGSHSSLNLKDAGAASARYRELTLNKLSEELLNSIKMGIVEMIPNFDNSIEEPKELWLDLPAFMLFAQTGIGVGLATNYFAFTPQSVVEFTTELIKNKGETTDAMLAKLQPLFTQSPTIINGADKVEVLKGNPNKKSLKVRATVEVVPGGLKIYNFPNSTCPANIVEKIEKVVEKNPTHCFAAITGANDTSTLKNNKENVVLELKLERNADTEQIITALYKETELETYEPYNLTLLNKNGNAQKYTLPKAAKEWYNILTEKKKLILNLEKEKLEKQQEKLKGIIKALDMLDEIIQLIRSAENQTVAATKLMELGFTQYQTEIILKIPLGKLCKFDQHEFEAELLEIEQQLTHNNLLQTDLEQFLNYCNMGVDAAKKAVNLNAAISKETTITTKTEEIFWANEIKGGVKSAVKPTKNSVSYSKTNPLYIVGDNFVQPIKTAEINPKAKYIVDLNKVVIVYGDNYLKVLPFDEVKVSRKASLSPLKENIKSVIVEVGATLKIEFEDKTTTTLEIKPTLYNKRANKGTKYKKKIKKVGVE